MLHKICLLTLAVLLLFAGQVSAEDFKFGVVDIHEVMQKSEPGKAAMDSLKAKFEDLKGDLDKRKTEIETLREEMEKQNLVLSQEAKTDKELELKRKIRDFQDMFQVYQRKMKTEEQKVTQPILEVAVKVLQDFGKKNKYTALMDKKGSGLIYADKSVEVTSQVILEVNKAWKKRK